MGRPTRRRAGAAPVDDVERRVLQCFSVVFDAVPREQLVELRHEDSADWDSVAHVTLLALLAEEFAFEIDFEAAQEMTSFKLAVQMVRDQVAQASDA